MDREMVLTRHKARESRNDAELEERGEDAHFTDCDGEGDETPAQFLSQNAEQQPPQASHQQNDVEAAMQNIQERVTAFESSMLAVTSQLVNVIQSLNARSADGNINNSHQTQTKQTNRGASTRSRANRGVHRGRESNLSGSDSESDTENADFASETPLSQRSRMNKNSKLPPYTGKEAWKVWINRFNEVAHRQGWTESEKLDEILPRLQGAAGDFVFGQLSHRDRANYKTLCAELTNRFRVVETAKTFRVQFTHRDQKSGETVEEYAAELKRLYDKAHVRRDRETRREDLLRRFLDGLLDDKARFHVEFIKEPHDIDMAVYQAVCFHETRHKLRRTDNINTRHMTENTDSCNESDDEIARVAPGKHKHRLIENDTDTQNQQTVNLEQLRELVKTEIQNVTHSHGNTPRVDQTSTHPMTQQSDCTNARQFHPQNHPLRQRFNSGAGNLRNRGCFNCGDLSHFKKDCPKMTKRQSPSSGIRPQMNQGLNYQGLTQGARGQSEVTTAYVSQGLMNQ